MGRKVSSQKVKLNIGANTFILNFVYLTNGLYNINVLSEKENKSCQFIKQ